MPEPVYRIRCFDREGDGLSARRIYTLDACQLLSLDRSFKYHQANAERLEQLARLCRRPAATCIALLRWQLFNVLVGNGDAHLKNLSFIAGTDGWELAPHYGLLATAIYRAPNWRRAELVIVMGQERRIGRITRADVTAFGQALGIPNTVTARELDRLIAATTRHAADLIAASESGAIGAIQPGEARLLQQIVYGPLCDTEHAPQSH